MVVGQASPISRQLLASNRGQGIRRFRIHEETPRRKMDNA